jgi:hypothetical protein
MKLKKTMETITKKKMTKRKRKAVKTTMITMNKVRRHRKIRTKKI